MAYVYAERTRIYSNRIGGDLLEVYARDYDGPLAPIEERRYEYRINRRRVSRAVWMEAKRAYPVSAYSKVKGE